MTNPEWKLTGNRSMFVQNVKTQGNIDNEHMYYIIETTFEKSIFEISHS